MGSLLMERTLRSTPNRVLIAHAGWLLGVRLMHFIVPPVQYIWRIVRAGGFFLYSFTWDDPVNEEIPNIT